jgi:hypothetical protein
VFSRSGFTPDWALGTGELVEALCKALAHLEAECRGLKR